MSETPLAVASAVILPEESEEQPHLSSPSLKRRQSSFSDERSKRLRFGNAESTDRHGSGASPSATSIPVDRVPERRKSGQVEERKRGQRLFGALLGTLSQSSSSTAQKRRTDIEKKQQAKLRLQTEEQDEKKKQKKEALMVIRRREQVKHDKQSMQIRHSNMLAQAHFLHTTNEPKLYYKPWELLPGDDERIKAQIEEAENIIERESLQWDADHPKPGPESQAASKPEVPEPTEATNGGADTVGAFTNGKKSPTPMIVEDANSDDAVTSIMERKHTEPPEASKDHGDDGGEVLEGDEDTVIY